MLRKDQPAHSHRSLYIEIRSVCDSKTCSNENKCQAACVINPFPIRVQKIILKKLFTRSLGALAPQVASTTHSASLSRDGCVRASGLGAREMMAQAGGDLAVVAFDSVEQAGCGCLSSVR